ncbi:copper amine oxidase N-terminal domain-containing protein [Paenibacillus agricola]|uniref:Copper amine oxidase N-terminal domain-containing protein n=1 Tax=Paenibacillus agricola TaxID=2716264 RepID=A0ABX0J7P2_9BACL|nr:copper amine oxidase N-terminal domain-containing protein [Paenibacillus agricola]NHN32390.1 copper amine oxidase N-terminal domain-containing protein [Paenibacillus agricola]
MKLLKTKLVLLMLCIALMLPAVVGAATPTNDSMIAAGDLRAGLGQLLGEHALLAVIAMQKGYDKSADFTKAADLLNQNTDRLTAAISSVYGPNAGLVFKPIWASHLTYLVDYVNATVTKDDVGRKAAIMKLDSYRTQQAAFFASANPENFKAAAIEEELKVHINHLLDALNAYANKDYTSAYANARMAYGHMFDTADMLASGIANQYPDKFSTSAINSPTADFRGALGQVLGEHALLAILAMQKGMDGKMDFEPAVVALGQNTDDLTAVIALAYGQDAGNAFKPIWASHIGYFVSYVKATAAKDTTAMKMAVDNLDAYRAEQAKFFATANPQNFIEADISKALKEHINHLLTTFDTYAKQDYSFTYPNVEMAYSHMFKTTDVLAAGISTQFPAMFPANKLPDVGKSTVIFKINHTEVDVNGHKMMMDVAPFLKDNFTYIPLRYASDAVGATLAWNEMDRSATMSWNGNSVIFSPGSDVVIHNVEKKVASAMVTMQGERLVVPVQIFAEVTGWTADLAEEGKVIRLIAP